MNINSYDSIYIPILKPIDFRLAHILIIACVCFSLLPSDFQWKPPTAGTATGENFQEGSLAPKLEWGSIYLVSCYLAWRQKDIFLNTLKTSNKYLTSFVVIALFSMIWSPFPMITFKKVVQLIGIIIVGCVISSPLFEKEDLFKTLLLSLTGILIGSFIACITVPQIAIDYYFAGGAWQGLTNHKNTLGSISAFTLLLWWGETSRKKISLPICIIAMLFCFFMVIMTKSGTALMASLITSSIFLVMRKRYIATDAINTKLILIFLILFQIFILVFFTITARFPTWDEIFNPVGSALGKTTDLSGRGDLWDALITEEIPKHPILGHGYSAFWLGVGSPSQFIIDKVFWIPFQAHNGYLEIINDLGLIGFIITLMTIYKHFTNVYKLIDINRIDASIYMASFILFLFANFTETLIFRGVEFLNQFFIWAAIRSTAYPYWKKYEVFAKK